MGQLSLRRIVQRRAVLGLRDTADQRLEVHRAIRGEQRRGRRHAGGGPSEEIRPLEAELTSSLVLIYRLFDDVGIGQLGLVTSGLFK